MARDPGREGCAAESSQRDEPLHATASRVRRWLLIEQPGAWGSDALTQSDLPAALAAGLGASARANGVRIVLIRRLDRRLGARRSAFLVRTDRTHAWAEALELDDPRELAALDLGVLAADEAPGIGRAVTTPLHLVCTNGRHDPCCADFGRPVVRALREAGVEGWECSHIGGDRFAANLVCLPTGAYFGRVPPEHAVEIVRSHDAGMLDLDRYRGRCTDVPMVQAAEIFARRELDERRLHGLTLVSNRRPVDDRVVVELDHESGRLEVRVARHMGPAQLLTCGDDPHHPWEYRLEGITRSSAPG